MTHRPRVVVMNDTRNEGHHGCARVMSLLFEGLRSVGFDVIASSPVNHDWRTDALLLDAIRSADVIVINGEGTLHDGKPAGEALLSVVDHPDLSGKRFALINALYQDNPQTWGTYLRKFHVISARDSWSAAAISDVLGTEVGWLPDLTLTTEIPTPFQERAGILFGDSVNTKRSRALRAYAKEARIAPILTHLKRPKTGLRGWRPLWRARNALAEAILRRRFPGAHVYRNEADYCAAVSQAALHVTGRFHAVCFSLLTRTPFLAIESNTWKIEALVNDCGLNPDRVSSLSALEAKLAAPGSWQFSAEELEAIDQFLGGARRKGRDLFAQLAGLGGLRQ